MLFALAAVSGVGAAVWNSGGVASCLILMLDQVRDAGWVGLGAFVAVYALTTWLAVPASWMQMAAGVVFGPVWGFLLAVACSTGFGSVSFGLGRTVLRGPVERRLAGSPLLSTLDRAVSEGGARTVALIRLSPISPYNLVNYALGLTGVTYRQYLIGTLAGAALPLLLYAFIGASATDLAGLLAGDRSGPVWIQVVGLGATFVASVGIVRRLSATWTDSPVPAPCPSSSSSPARR